VKNPCPRWYWSQVGGLLIEEFRIVPRSPTQGQRLLDGLIILGEETRIASRGKSHDLREKDVIVVQTKNSRLGMYLMGQTLFSAQLVRELHPRSVRSVALCSASDAKLQPMLEAYGGCQVVVCPPEVCRLAHGGGGAACQSTSDT
jgi:hypothetical protein